MSLLNLIQSHSKVLVALKGTEGSEYRASLYFWQAVGVQLSAKSQAIS